MNLFKSVGFLDVSDIAVLGSVIVVNSNVAEDATYAEWNSGTAYVAGNIVKVTSTHKLYESVNSHTNKFPPNFLTVNWIEYGATNRWKAFDRSLQSHTVADVSDIDYELQLNTLSTAIAMFQLSGTSVTVSVYDDPSDVLFTQTIVLIDTSFLIDWYEYMYAETTVTTEILMTGIPGYTGYTMDILIEGGATPAEVGEIAIGKMISVGETLTEGRLGLLDFSRTDTDVFGNVSIIKRAAARTVEFPVAWPSSDNRRIEKVLDAVRAEPTVFISAPGDEEYGFFVYGFYETYDISVVSRSITFATIEVRSLT